MQNWSYWKPSIGPEKWAQNFPAAGGVRQSPINITPDITIFDPSLGDGSFHFNYNPSDCTELFNKGTTWCIKIKPECTSTLTATHLPSIYKLIDIHGHWGNDPNCGSEHLISGVGYAAEIHIVHMNTKYLSAEEAVKHGDGLAVLGILLKETEDDNPGLEVLVRHMRDVAFRNSSSHLLTGFDFYQLLPKNKDYWTYEGSLTTPPCSECVIWTVFRDVLPASKRQLDAFRQMHSVAQEEAEKKPHKIIVNNYRAPQPVHNRQIRASFR